MDNQANQYDLWNAKKKSLEFRETLSNIYFRQGDIWWCHLGKNIGSESYGKGENFRRPVLILRKLSKELFMAIPLSMREKHGSWFIEISLHGERRWALLHQMKTLHIKRLTVKMGELDENDMNSVKQKLGALLELSENRHLAETRIDGNTPKTPAVYTEKDSATSDQDVPVENN